MQIQVFCVNTKLCLQQFYTIPALPRTLTENFCQVANGSLSTLTSFFSLLLLILERKKHSSSSETNHDTGIVATDCLFINLMIANLHDMLLQILIRKFGIVTIFPQFKYHL